MKNRCRLKRLSGKRGDHMRKKALAKDFRMEIKNSLNRFLSIFFIVALGVSFFAGGADAGCSTGFRRSGEETTRIL